MSFIDFCVMKNRDGRIALIEKTNNSIVDSATQAQRLVRNVECR